MNQLLFWGVPWVDIIWYYLQMGHESAVRIQWKYWSRWCVPSKHGEGTVDGEWLAAIRVCLKIGDIRKLPPTKKRQMRSKTNVNHGSWWGWQFCSSYHLPALRFWTIWAKTLEFGIRKHVSSDLSHVKISTIIISITSLTTHTYVCISLHILIYGAWSANELFLRFFFLQESFLALPLFVVQTILNPQISPDLVGKVPVTPRSHFAWRNPPWLWTFRGHIYAHASPSFTLSNPCSSWTSSFSSLNPGFRKIPLYDWYIGIIPWFCQGARSPPAGSRLAPPSQKWHRGDRGVGWSAWARRSETGAGSGEQ